MKKLCPLDFAVFFSVLVCALILSFRSVSAGGDTVCVQAENASYKYSLKEDGIYEIPGPLGNTVVEIRGGKVRISDSPCPEKTCVSQGWHTPAVCLPNKIIVTVEGNSGGFDAISE